MGRSAPETKRTRKEGTRRSPPRGRTMAALTVARFPGRGVPSPARFFISKFLSKLLELHRFPFSLFADQS
jgi:hypothetical protein